MLRIRYDVLESDTKNDVRVELDELGTLSGTWTGDGSANPLRSESTNSAEIVGLCIVGRSVVAFAVRCSYCRSFVRNGKSKAWYQVPS